MPEIDPDDPLGLQPGEVVCPRCHFVHWERLGYCPTCRAG